MDNAKLLELKKSSRELNELIAKKKLKLFAAKQRCSKRFSADDIDALDGELETLKNKSAHLKAQIRSGIDIQRKEGLKAI